MLWPQWSRTLMGLLLDETDVANDPVQATDVDGGPDIDL